MTVSNDRGPNGTDARNDTDGDRWRTLAPPAVVAAGLVAVALASGWPAAATAVVDAPDDRTERGSAPHRPEAVTCHALSCDPPVDDTVCDPGECPSALGRTPENDTACAFGECDGDGGGGDTVGAVEPPGFSCVGDERDGIPVNCPAPLPVSPEETNATRGP